MLGAQWWAVRRHTGQGQRQVSTGAREAVRSNSPAAHKLPWTPLSREAPQAGGVPHGPSQHQAVWLRGPVRMLLPPFLRIALCPWQPGPRALVLSRGV